jgi:hypothetical protein
MVARQLNKKWMSRPWPALVASPVLLLALFAAVGCQDPLKPQMGVFTEAQVTAYLNKPWVEVQDGLFGGDSRDNTQDNKDNPLCFPLAMASSQLFYMVHLLPDTGMKASEDLSITLKTPCTTTNRTAPHINGMAIVALVAPTEAACALSVTGTVDNSSMVCTYPASDPKACLAVAKGCSVDGGVAAADVGTVAADAGVE